MHHRSLLTALLITVAPVGAFAESAVKVGVVGAGDAQLVAVAASGERALKIGDAIYANEVVKTGEGEAQLIFLDRSTLMLKRHSDIKVDSFVYDPATADGTMTMEAAKGAFRFVGGALTKKKPVEIATPVGTIGIRGGIVDATVTPGSGATSAVFVYGKDLSFTNVNGVATTTHSFGTGFTLPTGSATPTALSAAAVAQHFGSFRVDSKAVGLGSPDAPSAPLDLGTKAESGKDGDHAAGDGKESGSSSSASSDGGSGPGNGDGGTRAATPSETAESGPTSAASTNGAAVETRSTATDTAAAMPTAAATMAPMSMTPAMGMTTAMGMTSAMATTAMSSTMSSAAMGSTMGTAAMASVTNDMRTTAATQLTERTTKTEPVVIPLAPVLVSVINAGTGKATGVVTTPVIVPITTRLPAANVPVITHTGEYFTTNNDASVVDNGSVAAYRQDNGVFRATSTSAIDGDTTSGDIANGTGAVPYTTKWGNRNMSTYSYTNASGSLSYTRLDDTDRQIQSLAGTRLLSVDSRWSDVRDLTRSLSATRSGDVSFYDFLPDLTRHQANGGSLGLFGWNAASAQALSGYGILGGSRQQDVGMAVDWNTGKFVASNVRFETMNGNSGTTMAYGTSANGNGLGVDSLMNGATFDFNSTGSLTASSNSPDQLRGASGTLEVTRSGVYGTAAGGIDGLAIHHTIGRNSGTTAGVTPGVLATGNSAANAAALVKTYGDAKTELNGFAGGLIIRDVTGSPTAIAYSSDNITSTKLKLRSDNATVTGNIEMKETGSENKLNVRVGDAGKSAYVSDTLWGAEQTGTTTYVSTNGTNMTTTAGGWKGAVVAGSHNSNIAASKLCTTCTYTQWGVWSGEQQLGNVTSAAPMLPVVIGEVTKDMATKQLSGTASYTGPAFANVASGTHFTNAVGTMNAGVDLQGAKLNSLAISFPAASMPDNQSLRLATQGVNPISPTGSAVFTAPLVATRGTNPVAVGTGLSHGALFGPQAQEIGGSFDLKTNTVTAAGVYQGKR